MWPASGAARLMDTAPFPFGGAGGTLARMVAAFDWAATPLGAPEGWPLPLRTLLGVVMGSNQPMFVAWGPERTLIYNEPYASILDGKHPAALGRSFLEVWHEIRDDLLPIVERAFRGEPVQMDDITLMIERKGYREEAHFAFSYTPVRDEGGEVAGFFCACQEITGQVLAERRLAAERDRFRLMFTQAPGLLALVTGPDHVFEMVNPGYSELIGHREVIGRPLIEGLPEVAAQGFVELLDRVFRSGEPFVGTAVPIPIRREDDGPVEERFFDFVYQPIKDENGRVTGILAEGQDVTQRVEAALRAREEAERVQLALDAGAILGAWAWDMAADRFTADERFARAFGLDPEDCRRGLALGQVVETVHPEDKPGLMVDIERTVAQGGLSVQQYRVRREDGLYYWVEVAGRVDLGPDGKAVRFQGVLTDAEPRRAAEAERDRATRLLKAFVEAVPGVVYAKDREGRMLVGNRGTSELIGKPPEDYLGLTDAEFLDDEAQGLAVMANDRRIMDAGEVEQVEEEVRLADGTPAVWLSTKAPMRDPDGRVVGLIGSSVDITARKETESALAESEARFRNMADHAPVMMWVTQPDGACTYLNRQWYEFTGQTPKEAEGFGWLSVTHPDDMAESERVFLAANARHEPFRIEYRLRRSDGMYRWAIDAAAPRFGPDGAFLGYIGSVIDIHERRDVEERLRTLTNTMPAMVWFGGPDGRVQHLNDRWYEYTGQTPEEALPEGWAGAIHPEDVDHVQAAWRDALERAAPYEVEMRYRRTDGAFRWHVARAEPVRDLLGLVTGWVGTSVDIDDRIRMDSALREINETLEMRIAAAIAERERAEEALRQSQKMEAVGQLTGGIAHDFNNLLAAVMGSLDLLGRRIGEGDARSRRYVDAAMEGARRAATLTQRLLAFSRQQPLRPEPTDVNRLVQGMSDLLGRSLGAAIRLETVLAGGLWRAHADPNQLENVILNLALNSRDAMPEGGRLTIETVNAHLDSHHSSDHLGVPAGQYVQVAVTDTGHGMTPEVMARAFDPFYTTKPVGQGTGLGLSQVYGFVRQSGGHVKIYSEPGQGTTVKVYLPRLQGPHPEEGADAPAHDLPLGEAQEVVLVVEDEAVVRQFTVDALGELGYRVLEAEGGEAALRILDAHPEVTLLFTDVVMPEMDGRRLADEALRRRPDLKVLFTTGYTRNAVVHNGVLDPGVHLIGKPFTVEALASKLREVLDGMMPRG